MPTAHLPTGIDLYYESHGDGEPLVLLPSTAFPADVWLPDQVPALSGEMRLILLDVRGVGRSTHYQGAYTIEQMACDVIALLDHLHIPAAHLLGHSMGGRIALEAALDWPERVKSLILAASGPGPAGGPGPECLPGLSYRVSSGLARLGFDEYVREEIVDSPVYFTDRYRASHPDQVKAFFEQYVWPHHARLPEYVRLVMARQYWEATHAPRRRQGPHSGYRRHGGRGGQRPRHSGQTDGPADPGRSVQGAPRPVAWLLLGGRGRDERLDP